MVALNLEHDSLVLVSVGGPFDLCRILSLFLSHDNCCMPLYVLLPTVSWNKQLYIPGVEELSGFSSNESL